jgi:hypothetical protein
LPPAELNISRSDREAQLTTRLSLLDKTADTRSPEFQAEVKELLAKLKMTRKDFRVGYSSEPDAIPDDLLIEILPPSLQDLARTTIVEMYR